MARKIPENRFDDLVAAATDVFIERGYRRTQMQDVADAVGVAHTSVGTLLVRAQRRFAEAYETMTEADETSG